MIKNQLKDLWKDLFNDEVEYIEWYFNNIYKEKNTKLCIEENEVFGMLFENKYHLSVDSERLMGRYLVGVGVTPERRGEGVMKELLLQSIEEAYSYGEEFIYLTPIDKNIYERFGFSYISALSKYEVDFLGLKDFKKEFKIKKIKNENYKEDVLIQLRDFYEDISQEYFVKVAREKEDYRKTLSELFCENGLIYVSYDIFGKINGYMMLVKDKNIIVKELLFKERDTLEGLLSILYGYKDYYEKIEIILPENTYLEDYLKSEKGLKKTIKNKVQVRILNVDKTLKRLSKKFKENEELKIYIQDRYIEKNTGIYKISKNTVEKIEGDFDLSLNIKDLATLAYGFRDYNSLKKIESFYLKNKDKEKILSNIFIRKINYFNQDF
ncbi:GNAT family N-acetyltransferase [Cetobacterium somerae]|uniref:GNAT family N-acetyltransferase n=1 Tax=Cetobacterium sp. NK01 TaxID=2993530 RepID=UPI002116F791|nr:GNAT family N-acetyltransferase [Cetobacterium sp. NK01]MCQ8212631.1 GNAT family N-acetyltransferase [Cetobacterium sp. NK01]